MTDMFCCYWLRVDLDLEGICQDLHKLLNIRHCYTVDLTKSVTQTEIKDEPQSSWSPTLLPRSPVLSHKPPSSAAPPGEREQREDQHILLLKVSDDPTKWLMHVYLWFDSCRIFFFQTLHLHCVMCHELLSLCYFFSNTTIFNSVMFRVVLLLLLNSLIPVASVVLCIKTKTVKLKYKRH